MNDYEKGATQVADDAKPVATWRRLLPQILASSVKNLLLLDLGMTISFSTIVIPVLLAGADTKGLQLDKSEATWFASIVYVCQPIGSVSSGVVLEPLGRKYSLMAVNVPHIIGWFMLYVCNSKTALFASAIIMGLGVGFMEAPILTYVSEICEPKVRGTLTSYANLFVSFGMVFMYILGTAVDWRTAALISMFLPVLTIVALTQVPETPMWLLARGREREAEKSLCWLRGWVSPSVVAAELSDLKRYTLTSSKTLSKAAYDNPSFDEPVQMTHTTVADTDEQEPTTEPKTFSCWNNIKVVARPAVLKPLFLVFVYFFFGSFTGIVSSRPYMIMLIKQLEFPIEPYRATVVFGCISFAGSVSCMATIAKFKKRPIALVSLFACSVSAFLIASIPTGGWVPFIFFSTLSYFTFYGATGLVWTLVGEVFPLRGRGQASGIAGASSYIHSFIATKSFISAVDLFGLHGVFYIYGLCSALGFIFLYLFMPETEGITLEEIEMFYKTSIMYKSLRK